MDSVRRLDRWSSCLENTGPFGWCVWNIPLEMERENMKVCMLCGRYVFQFYQNNSNGSIIWKMYEHF